MKAFLTYKEETTIHFDQMIDHGLYLISGPTGAGKTTIFDAMTFALYGVASGSQRETSSFRSDYADAKEETYVEMTFELSGKYYTIKRTPTYTRAGYKTPKPASALLSYDDVIIEGIKEVNQQINLLLGVDVQQFKQIVMIAQGEFTKLIYANSAEREKVLRHIFHSESLVIFENLLKEKTREYKEQYMLSSHQLLSKLQLLVLPKDFIQTRQDGFHVSYIADAKKENEILYEQSSLLQTQYEQYKNNYDTFSKEYYKKEKHNQDIQSYQLLKQQYHALLQQKEEMDRLYSDIKKLKVIEQNQSLLFQYQQTEETLISLRLQLEETTQQHNLLQQKFQSIKEDYQTLPILHQQKESLLIEIEKYRQLLQQQRQYIDISYQYQRLQKVYDNQQKQYQLSLEQHLKLQKRMERDQENVNQLTSLQLDLQKNEQLVKEINQKRIAIHHLSEWYDLLTQHQDKHYELSLKYKQVDQLYQQLSEHYNHEDENFKRQQAGILALNLKENEPCPVCGSLHHPHLATISQHVLSSTELEELKRQVEKQHQLKEDAYQEVFLQNEQMNALKSQIKILKEQLGIQEELSKEVFIRLLSEMIQITKVQEKTYQKRYNEVVYLKKVKKSLERDQIEFEKQVQKLETWRNELHEQDNQLTALETQLSQFDEDLLKTNDCSKELNKQQETLKKINEQIQLIDLQYHQCQNDISVIEHKRASLIKQEEETSQYYHNLKKQYDNFIQVNFQSITQYDDLKSRIKELHHYEKNYQDYVVQTKTLKAQLQQYKDDVRNEQLIDLTLEKERLTELETMRDDAFQSYHTVNHTFEQNQYIIQQLQKDYLKNQDIFEKYTMYQDLSDVTSGKNSQRLSFERYVLASYFEHILEYANVELLKMSQGRFALYRKQDIKGAKQQGLDLSVIDYETGMMRDVQSLSGGESFKAALSLALGLSSMIQSYAGGIELNTLFIDEGFGSLDHESIDQALSVLLDLKNDNKVIGIISHVDELQERIHHKIVVEKGKNGSHLHIEQE